jgi:hypothetical protein
VKPWLAVAVFVLLPAPAFAARPAPSACTMRPDPDGKPGFPEHAPLPFKPLPSNGAKPPIPIPLLRVRPRGEILRNEDSR